ncbi:DivIVA domain-containing protein [Mycobacterium sp.]|uniref:DivIVA domain-containing protein n=1 Tax=Mycobacterium sp. TaxID=1785 RepID=UPI003C74C860
MTAFDVQNMAFDKPPIGKRGYNEDEVDAFLDVIESELCRLDGTPGSRGAGQQTGQRRPPQSLGGFRALDRRWRQWLAGRRQRS